MRSQIFFTLSIGYGGMSTLSSYNQFNHNCLRDAIFIPFANCLTSFFAGFVIFSYMGYLSHVTGQDIDNIIQAGQGLAYVVYPHAVTTIPGAPFWAICFFFMIILLGIDSALGSMEVSIACVMDAFPHLESSRQKKLLTFALIFSVYFLGSLIFCLNSGTYWIEFFNTNAGGWAILLIGATECITVSYLYGMANIRRDINCMLGDKYTGWSFYIWYIMWLVVTPIILITITVITFTQVQRQQVGDYVFPEWTLVLGQMMTASLLLGIIGWPVYAYVDAKWFKERSLKSLFTPDLEAFMPIKECDRLTVAISRGWRSEEPKKCADNIAFEYCDDKVVKF